MALTPSLTTARPLRTNQLHRQNQILTELIPQVIRTGYIHPCACPSLPHPKPVPLGCNCLCPRVSICIQSPKRYLLSTMCLKLP